MVGEITAGQRRHFRFSGLYVWVGIVHARTRSPDIRITVLVGFPGSPVGGSLMVG